MSDLNLNILVVDDFEAMRFNMKRIIKNIGIKKVVEAVDGVDAMEKIESAHKEGRPFDIIFLDWNMPKMNGMEVLEKCKKSDHFKNTYIIVTTAEREQKSIILAMSKGANDYIVKPYNSETVIKKLAGFAKVKVA